MLSNFSPHIWMYCICGKRVFFQNPEPMEIVTLLPFCFEIEPLDRDNLLTYNSRLLIPFFHV